MLATAPLIAAAPPSSPQRVAAAAIDHHSKISREEGVASTAAICALGLLCNNTQKDLREQYDTGNVIPYYVNTLKQRADFYTKPLDTTKFLECRKYHLTD